MLFLQTLIFLTGSYAFFYLLTVALCLFLLDAAALAKLRLRGRSARTRPVVVRAVAAVILILSGFQLWNVFGDLTPEPVNWVLRKAAPFGIVNTYGLFAVMTTERLEIVVQGSNDGVTWLDYEFKYKPGDFRRAPRWVQPHQPRPHWQMWFPPLPTLSPPPWFATLI